MFGAIVGDIAGSTFERHNFKFECCHIFEHGSQFTDDTVLTLATASHFIYGEPYSSVYRQYGRPNLLCDWLAKPMGSASIFYEFNHNRCIPQACQAAPLWYFPPMAEVINLRLNRPIDTLPSWMPISPNYRRIEIVGELHWPLFREFVSAFGLPHTRRPKP